MTALADLLDAARRHTPDSAPTTPDGHGTVEDRLLVHERRYWTTTATALGLHPTRTITTLTETLTAAHLAGADTPAQAHELLTRIPALAGLPIDRLTAIREWITSLYPTTPGSTWGTLQPDKLAERFIGLHLHSHPDLAHHLIPGITGRQAGQLLTVYTRAAAHLAYEHQLDAYLTELCTRHADALTLPAIDVVTQTERPQPLLDALHQITNTPDVALASLEQWADRLPRTSHNLAPWAAHLTQLITDRRRERAKDDPDQLPGLALSLNNLAIRLGGLGRPEEALVAITEAVGIRRELAREHPAVYQVDLEKSLDLLSRLREQREDPQDEDV
ncbi:hypothetical protein ACWC09_28180 [Streptomyces sp. NPDC001617]